MVKNIVKYWNFVIRNRIITTLLLIVTFPTLVYGAEFSASVDKTEISIDDTVNFSLKLKDDSTSTAPDVSKLSKNFDIISSSQFSNMQFINGISSASNDWNFVLEPKNPGDFEIPSITINARSGSLTSKPIKIKVLGTKQLSASTKNNKIFAIAKSTKIDPYLNEPIIYQVKLYTKLDLTNTNFDPLVIDNAIVKPLGTYKVYDEKYNGANVKVIELSYLITPLKAGQLVIPSQKIKGTVVTSEIQKPGPSFSGISSLFDDLVGDQRLINRSEPFKVSTPEILLNIQPPLDNISPWIPAEDLSIKGKWTAESFEVGKPASYTIDITAKGIVAKQLPHFSVDDLKGSDYKVYADKSDTHENIENFSINSSRTETYTIIPLKPGKMSLPQLKINWWDVKNKKMSCSSINPSAIEVSGSNEQNLTITTDEKPINPPEEKKQNLTAPLEGNHSDESYKRYQIIIGILVAIIFLLIIWNIIFTKKAKNYSGKHNIRQPIKSYNKSSITSAKDLRDFLEDYAHTHWNIPHNSSLERIFKEATKQNPQINERDYENIVSQLDGALYANKNVDIKKLYAECKSFLKKTKKSLFNINIRKTNARKPKNLPDLNP